MALTDFPGTDLAYLIHGQGQKPWGYEVQIAVFDKTQPLTDPADPDYEFGYRHLQGLTAKFKGEPTQSALDSDVNRRLTWFNAKILWEANRAEVFDALDDSLKESLVWAVKKIRAFPDATLTQAETAWNNEMADELFDFNKLISHFRAVAGNVTWEQFKTYCINKNFEGID